MQIEFEKARRRARPPHACSIWADEDTFFVEMPSPIEGVEPTTVRIPCNAVYLWQLLRARANDFPKATIATPTCPTQLQLDELVDEYLANKAKARARPKFTEAQRNAARDVLRELGII